jgi:UDP-N-acetylglucosamine--N-acetylmuramyl-(pentapeptide) pyrophosphoryl-undecaprenol N-acetylglucosamine transferase
MKVLIAGGGTGGHLMPALAIAEALQSVSDRATPVLVGATRGIEAHLLPERDLPFHLLPVEPIHRHAWWRNVRWPLVLGRLLREGKRVLDEEQPAVAVGTGGYAAGPILFQASRRGIPIVLQEQNAFPGVTTRWLARRAREIYLGFPEARDRLRVGRGTRILELGNPIVPPPSPRRSPEECRATLGLSPGGAAVLVMGGSQGARSVNRAVAAALDDGLLDDLAIVWSVGQAQWETFGRYDAPPTRVVRPFLDPIADAYGAVDLVVARAGAMTTAELCAWALPSILVPLPTAAADHQTRNAAALAAGGAAVHLPDSRLEPAGLAAEIHDMVSAPDRLARIGEAAATRGHPNAAQNMARRILALVS